MAEQGPDILSHETRIAKSTFDQWRKYKHRRSEKCAENHKFANVGESIEFMHAGTMVLKLRGLSKKYPRRYFLDQQAANIRWTPSKKGDRAKIPIASIKELREVSTTDAFTQCPEMYVENQCFSIIHGDDFCTLDLVFPTPEEFLHWTVGLRYLLAKKSGRIPGMYDTLPLSILCFHGQTIASITHHSNVTLIHRNSFDTVALRIVLSNYRIRGNRSGGLLVNIGIEYHIQVFKNNSDRNGWSKSWCKRRRRLCNHMSDVTLEHCRQIIQTYEPVEESKKAGNLGIDGFTGYLLGPEGDIFNSQHSKVNQDMTKPLSHYFIASSHNTYLLGDQLTSNSSMDMYVRVLQSGCRCIELDCWDGKDGEPVIYHGYTMTSKVKFRYVILNINDFAFLNNKYPVILSIENHCSISQQKIMAKLMRDIFKDKLVYEASFDGTDLPSPQSLLGKILIKNAFDKRARERKWSRTLSSMRRLRLNKDEEENDGRGDLSSAIVASIATEQTNDASKPASRLQRSFSATFSTRQPSRAVPSVRKSKSFIEKDKKFKRKGKAKASTNEVDSKKTIKLSRQLSDLVAYTRSSAFKGLDIAENETHWEVISVPESKAYRFVDTKGDQFVKYTRHKLCRIFPAGYRIDSSNPNPQAFWNCGCQMVAVNYQTDGRMMQLYRGKFKSNGNCGYVLKPYVMCGDDSKFDPMTRKEIIGVQRKVCKIRVISGQQLPKPKNSILGDRGEIIDPFVEIEVTGIPADNCKRRTKTVIDNGFNPVWEETITFTLTFPNLAIFRFVVWDEDPVGRDFIGQVTLPFPSIMEGYRHVHLDGNQQASIFVHVLITDYHGQKIADSSNSLQHGRRHSVGIKVKKRQRRDSWLI
ncbi:PREDICTED: 1-phosphatidylinositol 4,5-bisphosphate phosphodiesterase eta-2-like [Acropora digitifera]|uniref:1-phosphatidylinositol 4,5-bisphosphate phosphodiesterase eta-2-like n=1 Tax=Acropora digitifera TaxID=70779 RepID=UPI00077ACE1C|nr:PREDICTED: 1-phosphatidylinositol 4,5-bisphosphate phosphodiesterase eta-2-like [Acropora digitifera]